MIKRSRDFFHKCCLQLCFFTKMARTNMAAVIGLPREQHRRSWLVVRVLLDDFGRKYPCHEDGMGICITKNQPTNQPTNLWRFLPTIMGFQGNLMEYTGHFLVKVVIHPYENRDDRQGICGGQSVVIPGQMTGITSIYFRTSG